MNRLTVKQNRVELWNEEKKKKKLKFRFFGAVEETN